MCFHRVFSRDFQRGFCYFGSTRSLVVTTFIHTQLRHTHHKHAHTHSHTHPHTHTHTHTHKSLPHTVPTPLPPTGCGSFDEIDEEEEGGYVTIDHWTVHADELPIHLQVLIPKESDWLGEISDPCIEVLVTLCHMMLLLRFNRFMKRSSYNIFCHHTPLKVVTAQSTE